MNGPQLADIFLRNREISLQMLSKMIKEMEAMASRGQWEEPIPAYWERRTEIRAESGVEIRIVVSATLPHIEDWMKEQERLARGVDRPEDV